MLNVAVWPRPLVRVWQAKGSSLVRAMPFTVADDDVPGGKWMGVQWAWSAPAGRRELSLRRQ
jgi:hypothetical protein